MNITANMMGLGNAATPFGIKAMEEMDRLNRDKGRASNDMALFLVLNAACVQLVPSTVISIRAQLIYKSRGNNSTSYSIYNYSCCSRCYMR